MNSAIIIRSFKDRAALVRAHQRLEQQGLMGRVCTAVGPPVEAAVNTLPPPYSHYVRRLVEGAIEHALRSGISTLPRQTKRPDKDGFNSTLVSICGAAGGMLGLMGLVAELPVMTAVIMRSIAGIALKEGEDLDTDEAQNACITVLALGGGRLERSTANTDYYSVRLALADALSDAGTGPGLRTVPGSAMIRLIPLVGIRFGATVSHKIPAQSVPLAGAFSGAAINVMLIRYYRRLAHGHFVIRRLERKYGEQIVMREYETLTCTG